MSAVPARRTAPGAGVATPAAGAVDDAALRAAIGRACGKIAPLWPLKRFVAVNPFLGYADQTFGATCAALRRIARVDALMPRAFYRAAIAAGEVLRADLDAALRAAPSGWNLPRDADALLHELDAPSAPVLPRGGVVATIAEVLDALAAGDRQASRTEFMVDELSKWCARYFDEGQAGWPLPVRTLSPYAAWRATSRHDRTPELLGIRDFRRTIEALPADPVEAIAAVVRGLGIPARAIEDYLYRALLDIGGWAGHARFRGWDAALYGRSDRTLEELLAIRLAWGYALFASRTDAAFQGAWAAAMADAARLPEDHALGGDRALGVDLVLQAAYELANQRRFAALLSGRARPGTEAAPLRPAVQAVFCIDVRSEVYRRALEAAAPGTQTLGFAGFFGMAFEFVPIGETEGRAQCPVLLKPGFVVREGVSGATPDEEAAILDRRRLRRRAATAWKSFKLSAVSSFTFVEAAGLSFAVKLAGDALGLTRPVADPASDGLDADTAHRTAPCLEPGTVSGRATGLGAAERILAAERALRGMSLTGGFARLVVLCGHGSNTVNNPYAAGLDCGACGGHGGAVNARLAAGILNDQAVRVALAERGIRIPEDTWFVGALHDTTTDEVRIFDADAVPGTHAEDLANFAASLARATAAARTERAQRLGLAPGTPVAANVKRRSRDWSEVRPEWGLAGNAAFIAAPRARTRGLDLGGRAFLHEYDSRLDPSLGVLELILTAPLVVASWINLQYYASTVNNDVFGSGDKTLHNVVGHLGVLEGNGGDLRAGLPRQSVSDGSQLAHRPLRLSAYIEAPPAAIDQVLTRHPAVRQLVDNGWIHLFAMSEDGALRRYRSAGHWSDPE